MSLLLESVHSDDLTTIANRIFTALNSNYDSLAASTAKSYIMAQMEETQELIDDIDSGIDESLLLDAILSAIGALTDPDIRHKVFQIMISATNKQWSSHSVRLISSMKFCDYLEGNSALNETRKWLRSQWDDRTFSNYTTNLALMQLFTIGRTQNMPHLPSLLHEIYSEWRVTNDDNTEATFSDFMKKSVAFDKLPKKYHNLMCAAIDTYSKRFTPKVNIPPLYKIQDNLSEFALYTLVMSKVIENMVSNQFIQLPFQIDFWIIPKSVASATQDNHIDDDDDDDSDDDDDDDEEHKHDDDDSDFIMDIRGRIELDSKVKYRSFPCELNDMTLFEKCKRKIQTEIESLILSQLANSKKDTSHNRVVCVVDRRESYNVFEKCSDKQYSEYYGDDGGDDGDSGKGNADNPPLIESDANAKSISQKTDQFYVFQPSGKYGKFKHDFSQEHLMKLTKECLLPKCVIHCRKRKEMNEIFGCARYSAHMFLLSFCCHNRNDIRIYWYINNQSMRVTDINQFMEVLCPKFFEKPENDDSGHQMKLIDQILKKWTLDIVNDEYKIYKNDLLQFHDQKNTKNVKNKQKHKNKKGFNLM